MLPPNGNYKLKNVFYDSQYADMENGDFAPGNPVVGYHEDHSAGGLDHRTFYLSIKNHAEGIATLRNKSSGTYATINADKGVVEGNVEQELQFTHDGEGKYVIHLQDEDIVWVLGNGDDLSQISAIPAPPDSDEGYQKKFWMFEKV